MLNAIRNIKIAPEIAICILTLKFKTARIRQDSVESSIPIKK
jgi:hypothetical protein